jgi:hypothetical protein
VVETSPPVTSLTLDLLEWIEARPRTYAETMEAWRTSCPRLSIWEDALIAGLVSTRAEKVAITAKGRALLAQPTQTAAP